MIESEIGFITFIIMAIFGIGWFIGWAITMVKQIKSNEYVWYVFTLLASPIMLLYWIIKIIKNMK